MESLCLFLSTAGKIRACAVAETAEAIAMPSFCMCSPILYETIDAFSNPALLKQSNYIFRTLPRESARDLHHALHTHFTHERGEAVAR